LSQKRSRTAAGVAGWVLVALAIGILAQVQQVRDTGSIEASLRVGSDAQARAFIEADLGHAVPVTAGEGHDGFHYYLAARDPLALDSERLPIYVAYRHRRILGPLLAGIGGVLGPRATIVGLSVVSLFGFGLAAGAASALAKHMGARPWAPVGVLTSVGLILSVQLVTADALTTGLALTGAVFALRSRAGPAAIAVTLAVLTKETSLLFAAGLTSWLWIENRRRAAALMALLPGGTLLLWTMYLQLRLGDAWSTNGNLGFPFVGLAQSVGGWETDADIALGWLADVPVSVAVIGVVRARQRFLTAITVPWIGIAVLSSSVVWMDGNNALRAFAPCWILGVLGIATSKRPMKTPKR